MALTTNQQAELNIVSNLMTQLSSILIADAKTPEADRELDTDSIDGINSNIQNLSAYFDTFFALP